MADKGHRSRFRTRAGSGLAVLAMGGLILGLGGCGKGPAERLEAARASMGDNDYPTAIVELKNVLQEDANNVDARLLLARSALAMGDPLTAEKELERAYELGADAASHRAMHYEIQLALGHYEEVSVSLAQEGGRDGLSDAEAANFRGQAELGLGRSSDAEASFREALRADPDYGKAKIGLAAALANLGQASEAARVIDDAIESNPELPAGWLMRGQIGMRNGQLEAARDDFAAGVKAARAQPDRIREFVALAGLGEAQIGLSDLEGAERSVAGMKRIAGGSPMTLKLSAKLHYAKQEYQPARADLQKVLNANEDDAAALFLLGAIYLAEGDPGQAELNLQRAVALAPANLAARKLLAEAQLRQSRPDSAVEALQPLLESEAGPDLQTSYLASQALLRSGETAEAIVLLEKSHETDPGNMQIAMSLGASYLQAGRTDDAVALFESLPPSDDYRRDLLLAVAYAARDQSEQAQEQIDRIVAEHPDDVDALNLVANYYYAAGQMEEARRYLDRVMEIDSSNVPARLSLARMAFSRDDRAEAKALLEGVLADDEQNMQARLVLAELSMGERNFDEAAALLEPLVEQNPDLAPARAKLALAYSMSGRAAEADEMIGEALAKAPDDGIVLFSAGQVKLANGKAREASGHLGKFTTGYPQFAEGWYHLARAQLALDEKSAARSSIQRALEISPDMLPAMSLLALLDAREGNYDAALATVERLQSVYPDLRSPVVLEGEILFMAEQFTASAEAFERAYAMQPDGTIAIRAHLARVQAGGDAEALLQSWLADNPDDTRVMMILAEQRQLSGDDSAAIAEYERALETDSNNAVALNNMAWLLHEQGDARAEEFARKALALRPDLPPIQDTLGWILLENGKVDEGRGLIESAREALPDDGDIAYHLAVALEKSGERDKSRELLQALLADEREFPSRADAERMLAEIGGQ